MRLLPTSASWCVNRINPPRESPSPHRTNPRRLNRESNLSKAVKRKSNSRNQSYKDVSRPAKHCTWPIPPLPLPLPLRLHLTLRTPTLPRTKWPTSGFRAKAPEQPVRHLQDAERRRGRAESAGNRLRVLEVPAAQADVLMRNRHPRNCHICMLYAVRVTGQSGPGNRRANSILVETHGFLVATIPGIWPVLLQKKQVDQADATQRQVVGDLAVEFEGPI